MNIERKKKWYRLQGTLRRKLHRRDEKKKKTGINEKLETQN